MAARRARRHGLGLMVARGPVDLVAHHPQIGSAYRGDNQDHELLGYRRSIWET